MGMGMENLKIEERRRVDVVPLWCVHLHFAERERGNIPLSVFHSLYFYLPSDTLSVSLKIRGFLFLKMR